MLVLARSTGESIRIGDNITLTVTQIAGGKVRIGFEAPTAIRIVRAELVNADATHEPWTVPAVAGPQAQTPQPVNAGRRGMNLIAAK